MTAPIRAIDAFAVRASDKTVWVFLRVTSADGIAGWGEATLSGRERELAAACARVAARLQGAPAEPQRDPLVDAGVARTDIAGAAAVSAVDQALWDLTSRRAGKPMRALLGPGLRAEVPLYANINRRTLDRRPEGFAASALQAIEDGFETIKIAPFDAVRPGNPAGVAEGIARAAAVREAIGPKRRLFIDCHWRFEAKGAAACLDALLGLAIAWFECPLPETPENLGELRWLRARANEGGAVLAGCETETGLDGFRPFIEAGAYDVLMPDIKYAGGLAEFRRIAEFAAARGLKIAPHNPSGPVSHVASLQLCAALANMFVLEHQYDESPKFAEIVRGELPAARLGASALPAGAGLGIALDPDKLVPLAELAGAMR